MKKLLLACAIFFVACILFFGIFAIVKTLQGEHIATPYFRFHEKIGNDTIFNNWSFVDLLQMESQKKVTDSMNFTYRVKYNLAKKFTLDASNVPSKKEDQRVGKEIVRILKDSLVSIRHRAWIDLDGQNGAVRNYVQPETLPLSTESIILKWTGTASPESAKDGFWNSIQKDVLEPENGTLASNRLSRTKNIVITILKKDQITHVRIILRKPVELQLTAEQRDSVLHGHLEILDRMRYVEVEVNIVTERLIITTTTAPILLAIWVALISLLSTIRFTRRPTVPTKPISYVEAEKEDEKVNFIFITIVILIVCGLLILWFFWGIIKWIIIALIIIFFTVMIYILRKDIWTKILYLWSQIKRFWYWLVAIIIVKFWRRYRPRRRECWIVVITLLLSLLLNIYLLFRY